jgi:hypothetical protein
MRGASPVKCNWACSGVSFFDFGGIYLFRSIFEANGIPLGLALDAIEWSRGGLIFVRFPFLAAMRSADVPGGPHDSFRSGKPVWTESIRGLGVEGREKKRQKDDKKIGRPG